MSVFEEEHWAHQRSRISFPVIWKEGGPLNRRTPSKGMSRGYALSRFSAETAPDFLVLVNDRATPFLHETTDETKPWPRFLIPFLFFLPLERSVLEKKMVVPPRGKAVNRTDFFTALQIIRYVTSETISKWRVSAYIEVGYLFDGSELFFYFFFSSSESRMN